MTVDLEFTFIMSDAVEEAPMLSDEPLPDGVRTPNRVSDSAAFAQNHVTEDLHPAFVDSGIQYDATSDCFAVEFENVYDEGALFDSQRAFADALEQFQQGVRPRYKSRVDLRATHTWKEVMDYANEARKDYTGERKKGITKKIDHRLKSFQTAAPAIELWLKLLPSTSVYGSVVCGGLTIILEVRTGISRSRNRN